MLEETSIVRQLQRESSFSPPYCPNAKCKFHLGNQNNFWIRYGQNRIGRFPYRSQRFQCKACSRTFSFSTFSLHYCQKQWGNNKSILVHHHTGLSKRESARQIGHSEFMVRYRLIRMARWGLLKHAKNTASARIKEPIVYDGLENFSFSQYDPNNINHAIGKNSLFIYDFNYAPINRKGRMSLRQVRRKKEIERTHGHYPRDIIRSTTRRIFARLSKKCEQLTLFTDRHFQYQRVVDWDLRKEKIEHIKISSKIARNFKNPLFAVNNIDLMARHNLAAFKRETIAFSKHSIAMQESFLLYAIHRNYMRPKFWGTHRSDPFSSKKSPAMELGLEDKILSFDEFFRERTPKTHFNLNEDWENLYNRRDPLSRRPIKAIA